MKIKTDGVEIIETDTLTTEQLKQLKRTIDDDIDNIEHQLAMARAERIETCTFADPKWYAKASFALKRKRKVAQLLQELLGKRSRAIKSQNNHALAECFVDVCKERMKPEVFQSLLAIAQRRHMEMQP